MARIAKARSRGRLIVGSRTRSAFTAVLGMLTILLPGCPVMSEQMLQDAILQQARTDLGCETIEVTRTGPAAFAARGCRKWGNYAFVADTPMRSEACVRTAESNGASATIQGWFRQHCRVVLTDPVRDDAT